jgi:hypothetical protein
MIRESFEFDYFKKEVSNTTTYEYLQQDAGHNWGW